MHIHAAGNVEVPAYLCLSAKGYVVTCEPRGDAGYWFAEGPLGRFGADGPIELLGVVAMAETRGESWKASDKEIEDFLSKFGQPGDG